MTSADDIVKMIDTFVSGADMSIMFANEIGVALDDKFPDDDYLQETVILLALYRPGGGEFLYDFDEIKARLLRTRQYLFRE